MTAFALTAMAIAGVGLAGAEPHTVSQRDILEAMRSSQGYDLTATTNGARFQSEVLRRLARTNGARDPSRAPLYIDHRSWFQAYLERTGLRAEAAPLFMRLAHDYGQDMTADYRRERVVESAAPLPDLALNVCIWWPPRADGVDRYSYQDLLSSPRLKVTNERVISYRLLDFGDMTVFGDIHGLRGRPTSGVLGLLFQLIGEGHVVENRMAVSADGVQVARARARRAFFEVASTVTVYPDGRTEKDVPADRPEVATLEARLKQPLKLVYPSFACGGSP